MATWLWLWLWLWLLFVAFVLVALASSTRLRKNAFIWFSYATITSWYYFRLLHKKYSSDSNKDVATSTRSNNNSSSKIRASRAVEKRIQANLADCEFRGVAERRQMELLERSILSHLSDSASSGSFDGTASTASKRKKRGLFRSRRKVAAEEEMRRMSDASSMEMLTTSGASESAVNNMTTTRRTYIGRKKPVSWTD